MASGLTSIVQNGTFGGRNFIIGADANSDNQVRLLVSAGQAKNLLRESINCGNSIFAKTSEKILNGCEKLAENDAVLNKVGKVVDFASKNINKLIVVACGAKVLSAEDKQTEIISQAGNIAGMFAVEGWMKNNLGKYIDKLPINSKLKPIVEGITFVGGSISGSTAAYILANKAALKLKAANENYKQQELNKQYQSAA